MSATAPTPQEPQEYDCSNCDEPFQDGAAVRGSYCSERCYYESKGESVLQKVAHDHRWCATCFRPIKEIERPPDGVSVTVGPPEHEGRYDTDLVKDSLVGFQYRTPHTDVGVDDFADAEHIRLERTRWSCECGTVDPSDQHGVLRDLDSVETIQSLWACLVEFADTGAIDKTPTKSQFLEALSGSGLDYEYAVGRALHA